MDTKRHWKKSGGRFETDPQIFDLFDVLANSYGCLPSDLVSLTWEELFFNIRCLKARTKRLNGLVKQSNRKKNAMLFPTISLGDLLKTL